MNKNRKIVGFVLLAIVVASIAPASARFYSENQTEKFVELAEKAGDKVNNLIENIYANETASDIIEAEGFLAALEGNVTLYERGLQNVTYAYTSLEMDDYEGAVANATEALQIFREVFQSIHIILEDSGLEKGQLIDAQGLIVAMQRNLEKIEQLRGILPENATEALELLDNATMYLNIDVARMWLLEGRINETAHNLTEANRLIAQVHQYLATKAKEKNTMRITNYIKNTEKTMEKIMNRLEQAERKGLNITTILDSLGYINATQFRQTLQNMIENATQQNEDFKATIACLQELSQTLREMDHALTIQMAQQQQGNGQGNNGNGNNKGNNGGGNGNNK